MIESLPYFIVISVLLTLAPGPDILFVITQSMSQGKKAGIFGYIGIKLAMTEK